MSRKWFFLGSFIIFLAAMAVLGIITTTPAQAQCGDNPADSSCITCHETQGADPVFGKGEWHAIHARKDCCWNCHGGNTRAQDKDLAHVGMTAHPLQDIYTDCYSCHPVDYPERAKRFAVVLGVTPGSSPTATPLPVGPVAENPIVILPPSTTVAPTLHFWIPVLGGFTILLILMLALGVVFYRLRVQRHNPA